MCGSGVTEGDSTVVGEGVHVSNSLLVAHTIPQQQPRQSEG